MRPSYTAARALGSGHAASDYDIGLYFKAALPLETERLLAAAKEIADNSAVTAVTKIGEWGRGSSEVPGCPLADKGSTCSIAAPTLCHHGILSGRHHHHGLPTRPSTRLLLGDLDGRDRIANHCAIRKT
ncbi:hypothetical protein [Bradyrhizobium sp. 162]|uniref:hypothetical protein n=1 Tax=Bradyrhizobium sp. 162 TaxID=2782635 RepID=UPI001FFA35E0|nr:hypothetical protein [Bradyrhizobium sp. 162]